MSAREFLNRYTATFIGIAGFVTTISILAVGEKKEDQRKKEFSTLVEKVKYKTAGEDRIWTTQEKREFLDEFGIRKPIGEGQDIYFNERADPLRQYVELIAGSGKSHIDSLVSLGDVLGNIKKDEMEAYLKR